MLAFLIVSATLALAHAVNTTAHPNIRGFGNTTVDYATSFAAAVNDDGPPRNSIWSWKGTDIPGPRTTTSYVPSACNNGGSGGPPYSFACIHHAMLSDDMIAAARYDGMDKDFVYATAGSGSDSDAGICYEVQLLDAEKNWRADFPLLIVQVINSGFDVLEGQLDLFMGGGGQGYFTAVNKDCTTNYCQGGPCAEGMFAGDFAAWTNAQYPDPSTKCYSGGIKWPTNTSVSVLWDLCRRLSGGESGFKDRVLWQSCVRTNTEGLKQNFYETRYTRVRCPEGLYRITGLRRRDDDGYPSPSVGLSMSSVARGSRSDGKTVITTMHDGCTPSAAWPGKVDTDPQYPRVDRCDRHGRIM